MNHALQRLVESGVLSLGAARGGVSSSQIPAKTYAPTAAAAAHGGAAHISEPPARKRKRAGGRSEPALGNASAGAEAAAPLDVDVLGCEAAGPDGFLRFHLRDSSSGGEVCVVAEAAPGGGVCGAARRRVFRITRAGASLAPPSLRTALLPRASDVRDWLAAVLESRLLGGAEPDAAAAKRFAPDLNLEPFSSASDGDGDDDGDAAQGAAGADDAMDEVADAAHHSPPLTRAAIEERVDALLRPGGALCGVTRASGRGFCQSDVDACLARVAGRPVGSREHSIVNARLRELVGCGALHRWTAKQEGATRHNPWAYHFAIADAERMDAAAAARVAAEASSAAPPPPSKKAVATGRVAALLQPPSGTLYLRSLQLGSFVRADVDALCGGDGTTDEAFRCELNHALRTLVEQGALTAWTETVDRNGVTRSRKRYAEVVSAAAAAAAMAGTATAAAARVAGKAKVEATRALEAEMEEEVEAEEEAAPHEARTARRMAARVDALFLPGGPLSRHTRAAGASFRRRDIEAALGVPPSQICHGLDSQIVGRRLGQLVGLGALARWSAQPVDTTRRNTRIHVFAVADAAAMAAAAAARAAHEAAAEAAGGADEAAVTAAAEAAAALPQAGAAAARHPPPPPTCAVVAARVDALLLPGGALCGVTRASGRGFCQSDVESYLARAAGRPPNSRVDKAVNTRLRELLGCGALYRWTAKQEGATRPNSWAHHYAIGDAARMAAAAVARAAAEAAEGVAAPPPPTKTAIMLARVAELVQPPSGALYLRSLQRGSFVRSDVDAYLGGDGTMDEAFRTELNHVLRTLVAQGALTACSETRGSRIIKRYAVAPAAAPLSSAAVVAAATTAATAARAAGEDIAEAEASGAVREEEEEEEAAPPPPIRDCDGTAARVAALLLPPSGALYLRSIRFGSFVRADVDACLGRDSTNDGSFRCELNDVLRGLVNRGTLTARTVAGLRNGVGCRMKRYTVVVPLAAARAAGGGGGRAVGMPEAASAAAAHAARAAGCCVRAPPPSIRRRRPSPTYRRTTRRRFFHPRTTLRGSAARRWLLLPRPPPEAEAA